MHHSYMPLNQSFTADTNFQLAALGTGQLDLAAVLDKVRNDAELFKFLTDADKRPTKTSGFQRLLGELLMHRADAIIAYVHQIKFPDSIDISCIADERELHGFFRWLIDAALTVYARSKRRNDFFLLHVVTSAYAFLQIVPALTRADAPLPADVILESLRVFLAAFLATYRVQGAPRLIELHHVDGYGSMTRIIEETLAVDRDEHIYKLVQICAEFDVDAKDEAMKNVYRSACACALNNEFIF